MKTTVWIDIESRSRCNLTKHGSYRYAADPTTELLVIGWAINEGSVKTWTKGQRMPDELLAILAKPGPNLLFKAHNIGFDRIVLGAKFPRLLDPERWYCTMTQARSCALAGKLDHAARMLDLDVRKDTRGDQLIRMLCIPQKDGTFLEDRRLLQELTEYCAQDVKVMRAFSNGLPPLDGEALALLRASERINDNGLPIDTELCQAATAYMERAVDEAVHNVQMLTDGAVRNVRGPKVTQWIFDHMPMQHRDIMLPWDVETKDILRQGAAHGRVGGGANANVEMVNAVGARMVQKLSLDADVRENLFSAIEEHPDDFDPVLVSVLEAVEDAAVSSIAKFQRMLDHTCSDGRLRGAFVMNGAAQTGRYSSHKAQLHNFPREVAENPEALRELFVRGSFPGGGILKVLKSMLRPAIRSKSGMIVRADWNAVEARMLPWLAGPDAADYLAVFENDQRDIYIEQAKLAGLTGRQEGKVLVLSMGYGGGAGALQRMARSYSVEIEWPERVVGAWRSMNSWAPRWWRNLEIAAFHAMRDRERQWYHAERIAFAHDGLNLLMRLPSGRCLYYPSAKFGVKRDESVITYAKSAWKPKASMVKGWPRATLWHGVLAENATQAACADLLRATLVACDRDRVNVIGHVHDEIIGEAPHARGAKELARAISERMLNLPPWATGLPLKVATDSAQYFRK